MIKQNFILYSLGLIFCLFAYLSSAQEFPGAVIDAMSSREERYHHFLWHYIRDNWNRFDSDIQDEIRDRGWDPPRPARRFDEDGNSIAITDNNSGEDFLYFHRQMIARVKDIVGDDQDALDQLSGWERIPTPDSEDWPVPDEYQIPGNPSTSDAINSRKTDDFYNDELRPLEERFTDPDELRSMTLGELGSRIENTVHNWMHLRFSSESSVGYRPGSGGAFPYVNTRWDDPDYDWLGDTYSSQVNPIFWKLHGWVDDRIEDWRRANDVDEIEWKGTWEGGSIDDISDIIEGQDEADNVISGNVASASLPVDSSFADNVQVDFGATGKALDTSDSSQGSTSKPPKGKRCRTRYNKRR